MGRLHRAAPRTVVEIDLELGGGLYTRVLEAGDAPLVVEATGGETGRSLWGAHPVGPYTSHDAQAALELWDPDAYGQFSVGILRGERLLGAVGLMPDGPGSVELAYWIRPEQRRQGIASRAVRAITPRVHDVLGASRVWLEISPGNQPSLGLAERVGYRYEQRLPRHCRDWVSEDAEHDTWHDCLIWTHHAR